VESSLLYKANQIWFEHFKKYVNLHNVNIKGEAFGGSGKTHQGNEISL
jgi:hypothetical protein